MSNIFRTSSTNCGTFPTMIGVPTTTANFVGTFASFNSNRYQKVFQLPNTSQFRIGDFGTDASDVNVKGIQFFG